MDQMPADLHAMVDQVPKREQASEAASLFLALVRSELSFADREVAALVTPSSGVTPFGTPLRRRGR